MTKPATFRQSDLTRALKAAAAAGVRVGCYEIKPDGSVRVWAEGEAPAPKRDGNSWDDA